MRYESGRQNTLAIGQAASYALRTMSRKLLILLFVIAIILLIDVSYLNNEKHRTTLINIELATQSKLTSKEQNAARFKNTPPLILMWTKWFERQLNYNFSQCATKCELSYDRERFAEAQYVVFHMRDVKRHDLPSVKMPGQVWVIWGLEAPVHSGKDSRFGNFVLRDK